MGVVQCFRVGCDNYNVYRLSPNFGYICPECFDELAAQPWDVDFNKFMANSTLSVPKAKERAEKEFPEMRRD